MVQRGLPREGSRFTPHPTPVTQSSLACPYFCLSDLLGEVEFGEKAVICLQTTQPLLSLALWWPKP